MTTTTIEDMLFGDEGARLRRLMKVKALTRRILSTGKEAVATFGYRRTQAAAEGELVLLYGDVDEAGDLVSWPAEAGLDNIRELRIPLHSSSPSFSALRAEHTFYADSTRDQIVSEILLDNVGDAPLCARARVPPPKTSEEHFWYVSADAADVEDACHVRGVAYQEMVLDSNELWGDTGASMVMLQFPFPFLGRDISDMYVSIDGYISLTRPKIPGAASRPTLGGVSNNGLIAPFFADLFADENSHIVVAECEDASEVTIAWVDMLLLPNGQRVSFSVTMFQSGVIYFNPPDGAAHLEHGVIGIEGDSGKVLMQQYPEVLTVAPWLRMNQWTAMVGPYETASFEVAMLPHMLLDHEAAGTMSKHDMMVEVDVVLEDMRIMEQMNTTISLVNPRVPPVPTAPGNCNGGAEWAAPTCAADQSAVPAAEQVVTLDCKFVAGMCPGLCGGDCPVCPCFDIWPARKCRIKGTERLCRRNRNVKANCKQTCSEVLGTECDALAD